MTEVVTTAPRRSVSRWRRLSLFLLVMALALWFAWAWSEPVTDEANHSGQAAGRLASLTPDQRSLIISMSPVPPVPPDPTNRLADSPQAAAFGKAVFFDTRFSANGAVSCATCHDPARAFTDGVPLSIGLARGTRNAPTVLDAAHQRWLTWDGRADSLWAQALHPFRAPVEMGITPDDVVRRVADDPGLARAFERAAGEPIQGMGVEAAYATIGKCLAAYERTVASPPGRFDAFAEAVRSGDAGAVEGFHPDAFAGLLLFIGKAGCSRCHTGPLLSDGEFHVVGLPDTGTSSVLDGARFAAVPVVQADPYNAAGRHSDDPDGEQARLTNALITHPELWAAVRTPSLRTAWGTAPYMHTGQFATLMEVIHFYNTLEGAIALEHHQERMLAPLGLTPEEESQLVAFLESFAP